MHGFFPAFLYLPKAARARFVIRLNAVFIFSVVDLFLAASSRCVVGIEFEDLVVSLKRQIVTARFVKAIGFGEQMFYFFNLGKEVRAHGLVEVTGLAQVGEQLRRLTTVGIVTIAQNLTQNRLRPNIVTLRDARFRQDDSAFAKARERFVVGFS